mmetsp:Transcript_115402/g.230121  ORF Transcript_115402/g.230121 Transcript_115402/m.230121 type:complete len:215 (+) Transcript_115402:833-1477(+)
MTNVSVVHEDTVMKHSFLLVCEVLQGTPHLVTIKDGSIMQAVVWMLLQQPQVLHDGIHVPCDDLIEVSVEATINFQVLGNFETLGDCLFCLLKNIKRAEALVRFHGIVACSISDLQHCNNYVVPSRGPEEHITHRVLIDCVQGTAVVSIYPVRVPDVPWATHPVFQRFLLLCCCCINEAKLDLCPILTLQWHEIWGILILNWEALGPQRFVTVD